MDFVGFDVKQIEKCVGNPEADTDNPVLKAEQDSQVCVSCRSDRTTLLYFLLDLFELIFTFYVASFR